MRASFEPAASRVPVRFEIAGPYPIEPLDADQNLQAETRFQRAGRYTVRAVAYPMSAVANTLSAFTHGLTPVRSAPHYIQVRKPIVELRLEAPAVVQQGDAVIARVLATRERKAVSLRRVTYRIERGQFSHSYEDSPPSRRFRLAEPGTYTLYAEAEVDGVTRSAQKVIEVLKPRPSPPPPPPPPPLPWWLAVVVAVPVLALLGYRVREGRWPWQRPILIALLHMDGSLRLRDPPRVQLRLTVRTVFDPGTQVTGPPSTPAPSRRTEHECAHHS